MVDKTDVSDFFDNDIVHINKGILGSKYVDRGSCVSNAQMRGIVISRVYERWQSGKLELKSIFHLYNEIAKEVLNLSMSVNGVGIDTVSSSVKNRLAVNDMVKQKQGETKDLEDR